MRTGVLVIIGLFAGFLAGIMLSGLIGLASMLLFDDVIGLRFLPIYLAIIGGIVAPFAARQLRHDS